MKFSNAMFSVNIHSINHFTNIKIHFFSSKINILLNVGRQKLLYNNGFLYDTTIYHRIQI